jgi:hypothetical protein
VSASQWLFATQKMNLLLNCSWIASNPLGTSCDSGGVAMTTDSEPFLDCTKLLLRAGADPTASFWSHGIDAMTGDEIEIRTFTPLTNCINHRTLVS